MSFDTQPHPGAAQMSPTRRNLQRDEVDTDSPPPQVVDPRNWNVPLALMLAITGMLIVGAFKIALLWGALDSRLARIEAKQDDAALRLSSVMTRDSFSTWVEDTAERNAPAWKPARVP